mgnify:CR=1 FL=1
MGIKKGSDGLYHINGKTYSSYIGSRRQIGYGSAYKTAGGLIRKDLIKNKRGRWVSKRMSATAKKDRRLLEHGYGTKRGTFGWVKTSGTRKARGTRKKKRGRRCRHSAGPKKGRYKKC